MTAAPSKGERRNRPPVSCEPCRARKAKCNRAFPCDTCIGRNQAASCQYAANVKRTEAGVSKKTSLKDRLKSLEALVSSLAAQDLVVQQANKGSDQVAPALKPRSIPSQTSSEPEARPEQSSSPETPCMRQVNDGQVRFVDSGHWLSVLDEIREVQEQLSPEGTLPPEDMPRGLKPEPELHEALSVLGLEVTLSMEDIMTALPPRPTCDRLLSHYFIARFQVVGIVHPVEFQKEYEDFWEDPTKVQQRTAECLILGRFATGNTYAIEEFILHLQSRYLNALSSSLVQTYIWFEMGTIIRLAFRMGYHRDPSIMPDVSPFGGEMRRRVWLNIVQIDAVISFHMGFPSMIPTACCDAAPPRNLHYADFSASTTVLPPSRPLTEDTPVLYIIAKCEVMSVFKQIASHTQSLPPPPTTHPTTATLDALARSVFAALPASLHPQPRPSLLDTPTQLIERINIELLHLKSLVVLHRRAVTPSGCPISHAKCTEAALATLARQRETHEAALPGGRLHERGGGDGEMGRREYDALRTSRGVWMARSEVAPEAGTAVRVLDVMLRKVGEREGGGEGLQAGLQGAVPYEGVMEEMIDGGKMPDWVSRTNRGWWVGGEGRSAC
ncbi:hypothetical protein C8A05DRAFT_43805 [Staphylotrichum tortipilum]|uniref:Zn(2)-C6 fungal-type domain-containing protein n=1 Tax=Staphylotrichum tortipilum TaxID=2831512 RepID=A0AAN6RU51_9PEZI|nr:hypothetical protein C8A05DRAFT_43805 [Staphylotrichum longicolle]